MTERQPTEQQQEWVPTFEGQRPPFPKNHELSLRHGAWSDRIVAPVAREILQSVLDDPACDYLRTPRFAAELQAWAVAESRVRLLEVYIAKLAESAGEEPCVGDLADERTRAAWALLHRCEARAMSGRDRLGLSPAAASKIGRDLSLARSAGELDKLKEIGRALLASHDDHTSPDGNQEEDGDD